MEKLESGKPDHETTRAYKTRVPDGAVELFDGKLVNRRCLAEKYLHCPAERVSKMIHLGLPHIKIGARLWFDPDAVLAWFKQRETQNNQNRKKQGRR
jgi:hypothetical protein